MTGAYVGTHLVLGQPHHHLVFEQDELDWQIWIAAEGEPLPSKIVMTFKLQAGGPQFTGLMRWDTKPKLDDDEFAFAPPKGSQQIEFLRTDEGESR